MKHLSIQAAHAALLVFSLSSTVYQPALAQPAAGGTKPQVNAQEIRHRYLKNISGMEQSEQAPPNFPVPVYTNNVTSSNFVKTSNGKNPVMSATIITNDAPSMPSLWYQSLLTKSGWQLSDTSKDTSKLPAGQQNSIFLIKATKTGLDLSITCIKAKKAPYTVISIVSMSNSK